MKACEALNVPRRTIYNYIVHGCVEYVRDVGGSIRIFADTLEQADRRLREIRRQARQKRNAEQPDTTSPQRAPAVSAQPAREPQDTARDLPFFHWSGPSRLVRNLGRPAGAECPCCGTRLRVDNLYDSLEPEYESEEDLHCLLCGWACHYQCRPLTRGFGSQFYIVATLRSFRTQVRRTQGVARRLNKTSTILPLGERIAAVVPMVFPEGAFRILIGADDDDAKALLAVRLGNHEYMAFHCRAVPENAAVTVEAVSLLRSVRIDWDTSELRISLRTHPVLNGTFDSEWWSRELTASLADGRQFLEFLGVCSPRQPELETLTRAHREEIVVERRRNPYRSDRSFLDLMAAVEES